MRISYANDRAAGPGHGFLVVSGVDAGPGAWELALQRASDHGFLGPGGEWGSQKTFIGLEGRMTGQDLAIALPPEIVDSLAAAETYRASLKGPDGKEAEARLHVADVLYSPAGTVDNAPLPAAMPEQAPQPPNRPLERPEQQDHAAAAGEPATPEETLSMPDPPRKKAYPPLPALIVLLLVCAGLAWHFLLRGHDNVSETAAPPPAASAENAPSAATTAQRVREFFTGGGGDGAAAISLARSLAAATPEDQDALYRLYYYAAGKGDGQGLLLYGQCLDPATGAWGSIHKDAPLAWQSYERAGAAGVSQAAAAMRKMRAWLEKAASGGNRQASEWLSLLPTGQGS